MMSTNGEEINPPASELPLPINTGIAGDLRRWPIFSILEEDFVRRVRFCCMFGEHGGETLFVTHDDEVWALGCNHEGCLGTGDDKPYYRPVKVTALCDKDVRTFAYGREHVLALTGKGEIYGWGGNFYAQVGKAEPKEIFTPTLVYDGEDPALEIACGDWHSVCRTRKGHVYCWGKSNKNQGGSRADRLRPSRVVREIADLKCNGIACGKESTLALFDNGEIYGWGLNDHGQLGSGFDRWSREQLRYIPTKVYMEVYYVAFKKVSCGEVHTLALAEDGSLYVWGASGTGQLGLNHRDDETTPVRSSLLRDSNEKIVDIVAFGFTSAVITDKSRVFMWGSSRAGIVMAPVESTFKSLQDVFATWAQMPVSPVPLVVTPMSIGCSRTELLNSIVELFDKPSFSDVKFHVGKQVIYAHRLVLCQSDYFNKMFQGSEGEISNDTFEVTDTSYSVFKAFVQYFYGAGLNVQESDIIELFEFAHSCSENALMLKCQKRMKSMITIENFTSFYTAAIRCHAENLEDSCLRFAVENLKAITGSSAFATLPEKLRSNFFAGIARRGVTEL